MTCTPYGVNTHRLLVRGHRINKTNLRIRRDLVKTDPVILDIFWILFAIIIAFILYLTSKNIKKGLNSIYYGKKIKEITFMYDNFIISDCI